MNELITKLAGLGLPGVILVIITVLSEGSSVAVAATLSAWGGPFGIVGGIALLGIMAVVGDAVAAYGAECAMETLLKAIYAERSKIESVKFLLQEIQDLPIKEDLRRKLKNVLASKIEFKVITIPEPNIMTGAKEAEHSI